VGCGEYPQEVERSHLVGRRRTVVERGHDPLGEAAAGFGIARIAPGAVTADRTDQRRGLADDPQLAPLALAREIVVNRQLVATNGRNPSAQHPGRMGVGIELTDQLDHVTRQIPARTDLAAEVGKAPGVVAGSLPGDEEVGDLLEVGPVGERVDRHPAIGELAARRVEPHDAGLGRHHAGEARADVARHRPVDLGRPPVETWAEGFEPRHRKRITVPECSRCRGGTCPALVR
jgi:hypothetical protein